ncbi:tyrosine-type recombinase/integrase [Gordonia alkanivorans]|uniref:tyrosine-type recombinase/integrase n=1 Tax=Gordonia alkanivorans TaxID=84096 RepID=UPI00244C7F2A|nr:site-specific integrase [Gordonia alkanivorans]MDH3049742.1 tyrosine-type recombinase/integrase [Gordonia alkanivorans]
MQRKATGRSATAAKRALKDALEAETRTPGTETLKRTTTITALCERWIEQHEARPQTIATYQRMIGSVITPAIGGLTIAETRTSNLETFLGDIESTTYRKWCRAILRGAFQAAVIDGALTVNPARETTAGQRQHRTITALTVEQVQLLRQNIVEWRSDQQYGPARGADLLEAVDVILGTGVRLGECLALRWNHDIDLAARMITVNGTIVRSGNRYIRQPCGKTDGSIRTIPLPQFTVDALIRQRQRGLEEISELVFPDLNGNVRDPGNLRRSLRAARGSVEVDFRTLRRTVATLAADSASVQDASRLLGHSRLSTTEQHYTAKPPVTPDLSVHFEVFATPIRAQSVPETQKKTQVAEA